MFSSVVTNFERIRLVRPDIHENKKWFLVATIQIPAHTLSCSKIWLWRFSPSEVKNEEATTIKRLHWFSGYFRQLKERCSTFIQSYGAVLNNLHNEFLLWTFAFSFCKEFLSCYFSDASCMVVKYDPLPEGRLWNCEVYLKVKLWI
jgi:hypothetical protein